MMNHQSSSKIFGNVSPVSFETKPCAGVVLNVSYVLPSAYVQNLNAQFSPAAAIGNFNSDRRFDLRGITVSSRSGCDSYLGLPPADGGVYRTPPTLKPVGSVFPSAAAQANWEPWLTDGLSQQTDLQMLRQSSRLCQGSSCERLLFQTSPPLPKKQTKPLSD